MNFFHNFFRNFFWALKFLTIIPIDKEDTIKPTNFSTVIYWFPVVGICIGIFLSLFYVLISFVFPPRIIDALIILASIIITGAFHLDGFADTCDGIWGGRGREKRLEIMRDSRIGSFGAIGLICLLGLKYISLISIGEIQAYSPSLFRTLTEDVFRGSSPGIVNVCSALLIMPIIGRWGQVCAAGLSRYARNESGTGSFILNTTTLNHVMFTPVFPLLLLWFFYGLDGFVMFAIIIIFTLVLIWYMKKKIGGMTGDTLGATNEVLELLFLLCILVLGK